MRWVLVVRECSVLVSKSVEDDVKWTSIGTSDGANNGALFNRNG